MISHYKEILTGFLLTLLLTSGAFVLANYYNSYLADHNDDIPSMDITISYDWDFSSGIGLSNGIESLSDNILHFSTHVAKIVSVVGQSNDIEVTCNPTPCEDGFAYASTLLNFYDFNTSMVSVSLNLASSNWDIHLTRNTSNSNLTGDMLLHTNELFLGGIDSALVNETKFIGPTTKVSEQEFGRTIHDNIVIGNIEYSIWQSYADGTTLHLSIIGDLVYLRVSYFTQYLSDEDRTLFKTDENRPDEYYIGTSETFFAQYTQAVNDFLTTILEG